MNPKLVAPFALAALAVSSAASAQSSVTLFGVVDTTLAIGRGSIADKTQLTNSGNSNSRLGFRGIEDLGGGLAAGFWLEMGVNTDDGTGQQTNANNQISGASPAGAMTFNRRSTVSLSGSFGEIRLGRDFTPQFWNQTVFDPYSTTGVGTSQMMKSSLGGPVTLRSSNGIGYFLPPNLGGFYGQYQHYFGENVQTDANLPTEDDGTGDAVRMGYTKGPVNAAITFSKTRYATGDIKTSNAGASYDFGFVKLAAAYDQDKVSGSAEGKGYLLAATAPVGVGEFKAAFSSYKISATGPASRSDKIALGYVHNLSRRTALYLTLAHVKNKNGARQALNDAQTGAGRSSSGYDFGLRHSF
jgi:predicted porin